jgi:RNA polymerase sigma factor
MIFCPLKIIKPTNDMLRSETSLPILHIFNKSRRSSEPLTDTIKNIKNGDAQLRENFIRDYKPFIISEVSKTTGKYVEPENSEEFSIGLIAFNEAIDCFDESKKVGFLSFAQTVIKRRLIDYIRKNHKHNVVYPFTYFDNNENNDKNTFEEKYFVIDSNIQFGNIESEEEISYFIKRLNTFGIELNDLLKTTPKHIDSKKLSISISRILAENSALSEKLERKKKIPIVDLLKFINVNHKTIHRNKNFIIAVYLILTSKLEVMQGYVENVEKGGSKG